MSGLASALLHRLDVGHALATFIPTDARRLRRFAFIDGRADFSNGSVFVTPASDVPLGDEPRRFILHVGFCGSTLLARLLDDPSHVLVMREPDCLADLANQHRLGAGGLAPAAFATWLDLACGSLFRPFADGEAVVVKPSNWANRLLPYLSPRRDDRALLLTISRSAFLRAVLRGGPPRQAFVARAALHLSDGDELSEELVKKALAWRADDETRLLALAAVAHSLQLQLLNQCASLPWKEIDWLDLQELRADLVGAATWAAQTLGLRYREGRIAASVDDWSHRNSKQPTEAYAVNEEACRMEQLEQASGTRLSDVEQWAFRTIDGSS